MLSLATNDHLGDWRTGADQDWAVCAWWWADDSGSFVHAGFMSFRPRSGEDLQTPDLVDVATFLIDFGPFRPINFPGIVYF